MNTQTFTERAILARHARQHQREERRAMQGLAAVLWAIPTGLLLLMLAAAYVDAFTGAQYVASFVQWVRS